MGIDTCTHTRQLQDSRITGQRTLIGRHVASYKGQPSIEIDANCLVRGILSVFERDSVLETRVAGTLLDTQLLHDEPTTPARPNSVLLILHRIYYHHKMPLLTIMAPRVSSYNENGHGHELRRLPWLFFTCPASGPCCWPPSSWPRAGPHPGPSGPASRSAPRPRP